MLPASRLSLPTGAGVADRAGHREDPTARDEAGVDESLGEMLRPSHGLHRSGAGPRPAGREPWKVARAVPLPWPRCLPAPRGEVHLIGVEMQKAA